MTTFFEIRPFRILVFIWSLAATLLIHTVNAQKLSVDSLIQVIQTTEDDTHKVITYRILAGTLSRTEPYKGIPYGQSGVALGKNLMFDKGIAGCYLNISACYNSLAKVDSAIMFIDSAIIYARKVGEPNRLALAYLNRADYNMQLQNFDQALRDSDTSLVYAERANNDDRRARVFQTIGSVYFYQEILDRSAEYYNKANTLYLKIGNLQMSAIVLNNLSNIYKNTGKYQEAAEVLRQAIIIADSLKDMANIGMYHGSLSDVYFHMEEYKLANSHAEISMEYAQELANDRQIANAWQYLGQGYLKQNRPSEGIAAITKGYEIYQRLGEYDMIHLTADMLANAYSVTGNPSKAYELLRVSSAANDTLVKQRYSEDIAAMQTRFAVNEKDKEIQLLNKDKELQEQRLSRQRIMSFGSIALIFLGIIGIGLFVSRNRLRTKMKELELRQRIAADLHDEVGSSLSSIHMLSQIASQHPGSEPHENDILKRMSTIAKETMEKMSDIVWMIKPGEIEGVNLKQRMEQFAYEVCSDRNIEIFIDLEVLEKEKFTMDQRKNIYLIFKEALNNALKYSGTEKIEIAANVKDHSLIFVIRDFGSGFEKAIQRNGNGLGNMEKRAKELHGDLAVLTEVGKGTTVKLIAPL